MAKNRLNLPQTAKLIDWLRENWKQFEGRSDVDLASAATAVLGFTVVSQNVNYACSAIGITRTKSRRGPTAGISRDDFLRLAEQVLVLAKRSNAPGASVIQALIDDYK